MAMKQTQTKLFNFSDAGLDFCFGSKNLFPDRFKKMLSLGYNMRTVSSVSVAGNQVTFTYSGTHGYVADRVLKVDSGAFASINEGEFWIDSVTADTVTFTLDDAPLAASPGFTTRIAPIGYELLYEVSNIHVYKIKHFDDTDRYMRLCFQNQTARRNCISVCIGKTWDPETGFITDTSSLFDARDISIPAGVKWEFGTSATSAFNDYTYSQGFSSFGSAYAIGSKYHLLVFGNGSSSGYTGRLVGFVPTLCHAYDPLDYPMIIGESGGSESSSGQTYGGVYARAYIGNIRVTFATINADSMLFPTPVNGGAGASFLPATLDSFNTTTAFPIPILEFNTKHHIGYIPAGLYLCSYAETNVPSVAPTSTPSITYDIDLDHMCALHHLSRGSSQSTAYVIAPVEEIKLGY